MRFGLIGCGEIGRLRAEALAAADDCQLVVVSDLDNNRSKDFADRYHVAAEDTWQKLIQRADVDAVIVSTPPSSHTEIGQAALAGGKHVLVEKPLSRTLEEAKRLNADAEKFGRILATGFNYRFYPSVLKGRELLDSGIIGELDHIRSYSGYTAASHHQEWLHDVNVMGGGTLRDNGIHLIDLTLYFLGGVEAVKGFTSQYVWGFKGCEDNGFVLMRSPAGKVATLQSSWSEWRGYKFVIDLYGTRGAIRISCFPMLTQVTWADTTGGKSRSKTDYHPKVFLMEHLKSYRWIVTQSFVQELEAFRKMINGDTSAIASGMDGLRALEVAYAASHSETELSRVI